MTSKVRIALSIGVGVVSLCWFGERVFAAEGDGTAVSKTAWEAWKQGNVDEAAKLASKLAQTPGGADAGRHLLCLTSFVSGKYEDALEQFAKINKTYNRYDELPKLVLDAYVHLGRYAEAAKFSREHDMPSHRIRMLERYAATPMKVSLDSVTVVPYEERELSDYFPVLPAEVNDQPMDVRVDTGVSYMVMGVARADLLGIELISSGRGFDRTQEVDTFSGIVRRLQLGDAMLEYVPVRVLPTLTGKRDVVILGTNVLQQFLSTLDYPNRQLILSPRGDAEQRKLHLAKLPSDRVRVPFHMWSDRFMFARGAVGRNTGLNLFIDSGFVSLHVIPGKGIRQAVFTASREQLRKWGFDEETVKQNVFESDQPLFLGPLEQQELLFVPRQVGSRDFAGLQIHGLISHAFLKKYAWTLDFTDRVYIFSSKP